MNDMNEPRELFEDSGIVNDHKLSKAEDQPSLDEYFEGNKRLDCFNKLPPGLLEVVDLEEIDNYYIAKIAAAQARITKILFPKE